MTNRKLLALAVLGITMSPLHHAELLRRTADDCKCDPKDLGCKIMCSGIGSGRGTGSGTNAFELAPRKEGAPQDQPVVPSPDTKTTTQPTKQ